MHSIKKRVKVYYICIFTFFGILMRKHFKKFLFFIFACVSFFSFTSAWSVDFWLDEINWQDWTQLWIYDDWSNVIWQYVFSTPYDVSTLSFSWSYWVPSSVEDINLYENWTILIINNSNIFYKYTLSTPYDLSTLSSSTVTTVAGANFYWFYFNSDWTKLFWVDKYTDLVKVFNCSSSYDLDSCSIDWSNYYDLWYHSQWSIIVKDDWSWFYVFWWFKSINYYTLSTPYDFTTSSLTTSKNVSQYLNYFWINSDWTKLFYLEKSFNRVWSYTFWTPYDLSTIWNYTNFSYNSSYSDDWFLVLNDKLDSLDNFQTDFETSSHLLNLKFCWDFNNDDVFKLKYWNNELLWELNNWCFEYGYLPMGQYVLELDWTDLQLQQDWSWFSVNDWVLNWFNNIVVDWSSSTIIPSITSITYDTTNNISLKIEVNWQIKYLPVDPTKTLKLLWWEFTITDDWYTNTFAYWNKLYYTDLTYPNIVLDIPLWNYDIWLNWLYDWEDLPNWDKSYTPDCMGATSFDWFDVLSWLTVTWTFQWEVNTWNIFIPLQDNVTKMFLSSIPQYIIYVILIFIIFMVLRLFTLRK